MTRMSKLRLVIAAAALLVPLSADAAWPTLRHDAKRTAIAPGTSTLGKPTRYWQYYVGGTLRGSSHVALDVNKDGAVDVVYLAGGKAIAKAPDDRLVWESPPVELSMLHGVVDLDGDGALEVVASASRNVFVLSGTTGAIVWKQPDGEVGAVGGVRLGDLDGDKRPELFIDECACCGVSATASPPGGVYHFDAGKLSAPTKIYTPNGRGHCGSQAVTLIDVDGDGDLEVAYGAPGNYVLTDGKTGAELAQSAAVGETIYYSSCEAAELDGRPGEELICFQNSYLAGGDTGGRRLTVLTYDETATPKLKTLWNTAPVPKATGALQWVGSSVADLDGDGQVEITVAFSSDGATFTTTVYDAKTGTSLGTIASERLVGVVDLDGDKKPEVITAKGPGPGIVARKFERGGTPALAAFATVDGVDVPSQHDLAKAMRSGNTGAALTVDLKGDGKLLPILTTRPSATVNARYSAYRFAAGSPTVAATYEAPPGIALLTAQVFGKVNRAYPQLLLTRNDGFLLVLDDAFAPTNATTYGSGEFKTVLPGMRVGGFVAEPIAPRLDGTNDAVIVTDSRGTLIRLNAAGAWMAAPPKVAWEQPRSSLPTTAPALVGGPGVACRRSDPDRDVLVALSAGGAKLWERDLGKDVRMANDPLAGDVNGDGTSDLFVAHASVGSVNTLQVYDGKTGAPIWATAPSQALSWGWMPFSVADYDGDGVPDLFAVPNTLRVFNGATGAKLAENTNFLAYFTPTLDDVDGDGALDVTLSRGFYPTRTLKKDLTTQLWIGGDDRPYQHGARAACNGGRSVWVQPSLQYGGLVRLTTMNGAEAGKITSVWLAGGALFTAAADATAAGKFLGTLGDVAIKKDLLGAGDHPEALIGSSDGHLYALDPCNAKLDWAYDMRFAVGNPILADTSGDGIDEILVPAADGYLYSIGQRLLDAPTEVNDNDPFAPMPAADLDEVATIDRLGASWSAVAGADGYQVAVTTEGGTYVTQPDWVDVEAVTSTTLKGLSLAVGKKYFVAVRAVSKTKGSSLETRSDGVVVKEPPPMDGGLGDATLGPDDTGAGPAEDSAVDAPTTPPAADSPAADSGCGCRTTARGDHAGLLALLAMIGLVIKGRRTFRCTPR